MALDLTASPKPMHLVKLAIACSSLITSSLGILYVWIDNLPAPSFSEWWSILLPLWFGVALTQLNLSLAWIEDRVLGGWAAGLAGVLGIAGLLAYPTVVQISGRQSLEVKSFLLLLGQEVLWVIPAFVLAVYLT